jgi:hypothetical protein
MLPLIEEVKSFCREYVNSKEVRTPERDEKIKTAYKIVTGKAVRKTCGTCLIEAILTINNYTMSRYVLKKGARLVAFGNFSKNATNKNMTDELAEWHLARNPTVAKLFEIIPGKEEPKIKTVSEPVIKVYPKTEPAVVLPELKSETVKKPRKNKK